jgi:pimeloyl-ACP methyl ester carboxylesterase
VFGRTTEATRRDLRVGPSSVRVFEAGPHQASEAVAFFHGNPGSAGDWVDLVEDVGGLARAIAFDLPGFGQSPSPPGFGHTLEEYADWVGRALDAAGISRVHLVLHDFGGPIALVWGARNPERVASVTLFNTGILTGYDWHTMARVWQTPVLGELSMMLSSRQVFRRAVSSAEPRGLPGDFLDEMFDNYDRETRSAVLDLYRSAKNLGDRADEVARQLAAADTPALVVWGAKDHYLNASFASRQREAFPSAEVHLVPDSGHWPFIDSPEICRALLVAFLEQRS